MAQPIKDGSENASIPLDTINRLDTDLFRRFEPRIRVVPDLSRFFIGFQMNKTRPVYRWFRFKEAFSAALVEHLLQKYPIASGRILDPFAGSGTALFAASAMGIDADGIELLPVGCDIITTRHMLETAFTSENEERLRQWSVHRVWEQSPMQCPIPDVRITHGAYPPEVRAAMGKYMAAWEHEHLQVQMVLRLALLCIVERISFTRKDGQFLRWDTRSGRARGKRGFDKGPIPCFAPVICEKIDEILMDLAVERQRQRFLGDHRRGIVHLYPGSCLHILPQLPDTTYDAIITSPPYCNRYDYTRTYALELALLGLDEQAFATLRQMMVSCTVEQQAKDLVRMNPQWSQAVAVVDSQSLLQTILAHLEHRKAHGTLNNNGIPRMVRGYFYEMACVLVECARVLKPNARLFMVNDNVRYAGVDISVDLILSDIAEMVGFSVEQILVVPNGKGNSSQQMGTYGRKALRKCIYVWKKG